MTVELPKLTIGDRILKIPETRRAVYISNFNEKQGQYVYTRAPKEPFVRVLLRTITPIFPTDEFLSIALNRRSPIDCNSFI